MTDTCVTPCVTRRKQQTCSLFFGSLNAASAKSPCGTNFCLGKNLDTPIRICVRIQGGTMSSAIWKIPSRSQPLQVFCIARKGKVFCIAKSLSPWRSNTLHIGATRMAPSQFLGCFKCTLRATAPPIDCPKRKLGTDWYSGFPANRKLLRPLILVYIITNMFFL